MKVNITKDITEERKRLMDQFIIDTTNAINSHVNNVKTINVGKFVIRVQTSCELSLPPKPEIPPCPVTLECLEGHYEGEILAKAVANLTKGEPNLPLDVMARMGNCELTLEKEISLTVYHNCLIDDFEKYYSKYFDQLIDKMESKGFTYDPETKKFSKSASMKLEGE